MRLQLNKSTRTSRTFDEFGLNPELYSVKPNCSAYAFFCPHCASELYVYFKRTNFISWVSSYKKELEQYRETHEPGKVKIGHVRVPDELKNLTKKEVDELFVKDEKICEQINSILDKDNEEWREEFRFYIRDEFSCPVCNSSISKNKGYAIHVGTLSGLLKFPDAKLEDLVDCSKTRLYRINSLNKEDFDSIFSYMRKLRNTEEKKLAENDVLSFVDNVKAGNISKSLSKTVVPANLKDYLLKLIKLETNLHSITKRLEMLYQQRFENNRLVIGDNYSGAYELSLSLEQAKENQDGCLLKLEEIKQQLSSDNYCIEPFSKEPPKEPQQPNAPEYITPSLFNKKKVIQENEVIKQKYEHEVMLYNGELLKYNQQLQMWIDEKKEYEKAQIERLKVDQEKKLEIYNQEYLKATSEVERVQVLYDKAIAGGNEQQPTPAKANKIILDEEINMAEKLYTEVYQCKEDMYGLNVIFGKYRNLPAITTFYEYLMAGRCETLDGANGAYNIYEQELRANIVIDQLADIITSLEEIKQSQYVIYSELQEMNTTLVKMETTLTTATESIRNIEANTTDMKEYLENISKNSDVIAHNTAKTAYYSKMNAELTDSLGFMMALS